MESKNLNEQLKDLEEILFKNETLKEVLRRLEKSNLKNYYVGAGCINQTVFNYLHGFKIDDNINDYDIVYYDKDTSYEKEDKIINHRRQLRQRYLDSLKVGDIKSIESAKQSMLSYEIGLKLQQQENERDF